MTEFIGRKVRVGLGVESAYGTAVAPTIWPKHTKFNFQRKTTTVQNVSAMGRNEKVNDSALVEAWAEGTLEGKVYDLSFPILLYNILGSLSSADNADTNPVVKDHTINVDNSVNIAKSITIAKVDPNTDRRHGMGTLENLDITCDQGGWVMFSGALHALQGSTATDTPADTAENSFTSKHVTVKLATNVAGLTGATAIPIKSFKMSIKRNDVNKYFTVGGIDPTGINTGTIEVEGELVLKYTDTTYEALWFANTQQALQISIVNSDVTIGAAAKPGFVFTMPKVRLDTLDQSDDLDTIVEQTVAFRAELDISSGYMIRCVVTNTNASY